MNRFLQESLIALIILVLPGSALAQDPVILEGRVVQAGTTTGIDGATVRLSSERATSTDPSGYFRFADVARNRYGLVVEALGYRPAEFVLVLKGDSTIVVELEVSPVVLDSLPVVGRTVTVRGEVKDNVTGIGVIDAEVRSSRGHDQLTDPIGRFKLSEVPAGPPFVVEVRAFGYLPITRSVTATADTTLAFQLQTDSVVQKMIDLAVERLEQRSRPLRTSLMPPIDRAELLRSMNATVDDVLNRRYDFFLNRVRCVLIDDVQRHNGMDELAFMLPDRLERIEVLERGKMLRVYTRDYIRRMVAGGVTLKPPVYVEHPPEPYCR